MTLVFVSSFQQCVAHHKSPSLAQTKTNTLTPRGTLSLLLTAPAAPHPELDTLGRRRQCNDFWKKEHPRTLLHHADGPP